MSQISSFSNSEISKRNVWISFSFGFLLIALLALTGYGISEQTNIVNLDSPVITVAQMVSVGLGAGYYFGAALKKDSSSAQWVFLGAFCALGIIAIWVGRDLLIFGEFPVYVLLLLAAIVSFLAHWTPAIQNTETYRYWFRNISGYITTVVVVLTSTAEYVMTLLIELSEILHTVGLFGSLLIGGMLGYLLCQL